MLGAWLPFQERCFLATVSASYFLAKDISSPRCFSPRCFSAGISAPKDLSPMMFSSRGFTPRMSSPRVSLAKGFPRQGVPLAKGFLAPRGSSRQGFRHPGVPHQGGSSPRGFLTKGFLTISGADVPSMGEEYVTMDNPSSCPEIPIKTNLMFSCHCGYLEWLHDGIILSNIHSRPPRARRRS